MYLSLCLYINNDQTEYIQVMITVLQLAGPKPDFWNILNRKKKNAVKIIIIIFNCYIWLFDGNIKTR